MLRLAVATTILSASSAFAQIVVKTSETIAREHGMKPLLTPNSNPDIQKIYTELGLDKFYLHEDRGKKTHRKLRDAGVSASRLTREKPRMYGSSHLPYKEGVTDPFGYYQREGMQNMGVLEAHADGICGDPRISMAIFDNGIAFQHEDLGADAAWTNDKETPGDGIDNDGNGWIDDYHGMYYATTAGPTTSFIDGVRYRANITAPIEPIENYGSQHGTFVAGLAAARGNNGYGAFGVAGGGCSPQKTGIKLIDLAYLGDDTISSVGLISAYIESLIYSAHMNISIHSNSWGFSNQFGIFTEAVTAAENYFMSHGRGGLGGILIAAAGNDDLPTTRPENGDDSIFANVHIPRDAHLISGVYQTLTPAGYSSYGNVSLCTVINLYCTVLPENGDNDFVNGYGFGVGTSGATPVAGGVMALILEAALDANVSITSQQAWDCVRRTGKSHRRVEKFDYKNDYMGPVPNAIEAIKCAREEWWLDDTKATSHPIPEVVQYNYTTGIPIKVYPTTFDLSNLAFGHKETYQVCAGDSVTVRWSGSDHMGSLVETNMLDYDSCSTTATQTELFPKDKRRFAMTHTFDNLGAPYDGTRYFVSPESCQSGIKFKTTCASQCTDASSGSGDALSGDDLSSGSYSCYSTVLPLVVGTLTIDFGPFYEPFSEENTYSGAQQISVVASPANQLEYTVVDTTVPGNGAVYTFDLVEGSYTITILSSNLTDVTPAPGQNVNADYLSIHYEKDDGSAPAYDQSYKFNEMQRTVSFVLDVSADGSWEYAARAGVYGDVPRLYTPDLDDDGEIRYDENIWNSWGWPCHSDLSGSGCYNLGDVYVHTDLAFDQKVWFLRGGDLDDDKTRGCELSDYNTAPTGGWAGKIIFINRGLCGFTRKWKMCATQGAALCVVANTDPGGGRFLMVMSDEESPLGEFPLGLESLLTMPIAVAPTATGDFLREKYGLQKDVFLYVPETIWRTVKAPAPRLSPFVADCQGRDQLICPAGWIGDGECHGGAAANNDCDLSCYATPTSASVLPSEFDGGDCVADCNDWTYIASADRVGDGFCDGDGQRTRGIDLSCYTKNASGEVILSYGNDFPDFGDCVADQSGRSYANFSSYHPCAGLFVGANFVDAKCPEQMVTGFKAVKILSGGDMRAMYDENNCCDDDGNDNVCSVPFNASMVLSYYDPASGGMHPHLLQEWHGGINTLGGKNTGFNMGIFRIESITVTPDFTRLAIVPKLRGKSVLDIGYTWEGEWWWSASLYHTKEQMINALWTEQTVPTSYASYWTDTTMTGLAPTGTYNPPGQRTWTPDDIVYLDIPYGLEPGSYYLLVTTNCTADDPTITGKVKKSTFPITLHISADDASMKTAEPITTDLRHPPSPPPPTSPPPPMPPAPVIVSIDIKFDQSTNSSISVSAPSTFTNADPTTYYVSKTQVQYYTILNVAPDTRRPPGYDEMDTSTWTLENGVWAVQTGQDAWWSGATDLEGDYTISLGVNGNSDFANVPAPNATIIGGGLPNGVYEIALRKYDIVWDTSAGGSWWLYRHSLDELVYAKSSFFSVSDGTLSAFDDYLTISSSTNSSIDVNIPDDYVLCDTAADGGCIYYVYNAIQVIKLDTQYGLRNPNISVSDQVCAGAWGSAAVGCASATWIPENDVFSTAGGPGWMYAFTGGESFSVLGTNTTGRGFGTNNIGAPNACPGPPGDPVPTCSRGEGEFADGMYEIHLWKVASTWAIYGYSYSYSIIEQYSGFIKITDGNVRDARNIDDAGGSRRLQEKVSPKTKYDTLQVFTG